MAEAATLDLITKAMVKTYFSIASTNTDYDDLIDNHLLGARAYVKDFCRQDFESKARTNEKPIINRYDSEFYLKYYPVASITSLTEDGTALTEDTDFFCDKDTGRIEKIASTSITNPTRNEFDSWNPERNVIIVNYTGGEALTDDVIMAVKEICGINAGIKKRTYVDNEGVERVATINSYPNWVMDTLKRHRRRGLSR